MNTQACSIDRGVFNSHPLGGRGAHHSQLTHHSKHPINFRHVIELYSITSDGF
ncbi:hypothetical protein Hanom_Chr12g01068341 [Helianthus anomalus]